MKNLIVLLIVGSFANCLHAQTTFLVTDGEGIPIANVDVLSSKTNIGKTDKEGMFKVSSIKKSDTIIFKSGKDYETYIYVATKSNPKDLQEIELEVKTIEERLGLDFNVAVPEPENTQDEEKIYDSPEVQASFPGGREKMNLYISNVLQKPAEQHDELHFLKSYVKMIVEKDGMLSNIQIVREANNCPECDKEALRVVKSMPKFQPAMNNGRAVRSYFIFPVKFEYD
jgi:protein TonB